MTTETTLGKKINWSMVISAVIGALAPVAMTYLADLQEIFNKHDALKPLALVIPVITGWIAAAGTRKGSLGRKPKTATLTSTDPVGKGG